MLRDKFTVNAVNAVSSPSFLGIDSKLNQHSIIPNSSILIIDAMILPCKTATRNGNEKRQPETAIEAAKSGKTVNSERQDGADRNVKGKVGVKRGKASFSRGLGGE
jgi:hypothetical protein